MHVNVIMSRRLDEHLLFWQPDISVDAVNSPATVLVSGFISTISVHDRNGAYISRHQQLRFTSRIDSEAS